MLWLLLHAHPFTIVLFCNIICNIEVKLGPIVFSIHGIDLLPFGTWNVPPDGSFLEASIHTRASPSMARDPIQEEFTQVSKMVGADIFPELCELSQ